MACPKNAIPLAKENPDWTKGPNGKTKIICQDCGWKGNLPEMLCDPSPNGTETLWCPQCHTPNWIFD